MLADRVRMGSSGGLDLVPGPNRLIAGTMQAGYFGTVPTSEFIAGNDLASLVGLSAGTGQFPNEPWLKFAYKGNIQFVAKKPFRHSLSWYAINNIDCVYGDRIVEIDGLTYKVRLMESVTGAEWDTLMYPIHVDYNDWGIGFTDQELHTHINHGSGAATWCQESVGSNRGYRGLYGVSSNLNGPADNAGHDKGWRPVLELV